MGSLFSYDWLKRRFSRKKKVRAKANAPAARPAARPTNIIPPELEEETHHTARLVSDIEDTTKPMVATEVNLKGFLPEFAVNAIDDLLVEGCRAFLIEPEEEHTRWFAVFDEGLREIGRTPVEEHKSYLHDISDCESGAISVADMRFRLEDFVSFNEFGDRMSLQFFQEGRYSYIEAIKRRQDNVRLINRLKPASALTAKNENDIAEVIVRNKKTDEFLRQIVVLRIVPAERLENLPPHENLALKVLQDNIFPRKMAAQALADSLGIEFVDVENVPFSKKAACMFDEAWELRHQAVPFDQVGEEIKVAMMDPTDQAVLSEIQEKTKFVPVPFCASAQDITSMVKKAHKNDD